MDTGKSYYDSNNNECSILQLVKREPEWSANRVQEGEKAIEEVARLQAKNERLENELTAAYSDATVTVEAVIKRTAKACAEIARKQAQRERNCSTYAEGWADCADKIEALIIKKYGLEES